MFDLWLTPWRATLSLTAATLETMMAAQKSMAMLAPMGTVEPVTENKLRDAFHVAADVNLRRWEDTAGAIQNLPNWYHEMNRMPGNLMTDWFDAARRAPKA
ncbi:hypothetical protein HY29_11265 [Hyphomonas beringensis]|uniref:Uncharacterized protein n=1 Tax=Hyphomonas beringensis TaxID=1280946 RepID=A0A062UBP4_9PROT|nr:hypothetical protein [Hyphomonas beringensis]KCZ55697.1 hypothetical protein HY29_11265 [Hyphomonas beringensis]